MIARAMPTARARQRGISLLEVLVAFVIMAMSLGVLYQALGGSVRGFAASETSVRAALLAESLLSLHEVVPEEGLNASGRDHSGFEWHVFSEPYELDVEPPPWQLHRVIVEISWPDRSQPRSLRLWTLRPVLKTP